MSAGRLWWTSFWSRCWWCRCFWAMLQIGLFLYVRNTVTAAASEGAHYAAVLNREPGDGEARTRELWTAW